MFLIALKHGARVLCLQGSVMMFMCALYVLGARAARTPQDNFRDFFDGYSCVLSVVFVALRAWPRAARAESACA